MYKSWSQFLIVATKIDLWHKSDSYWLLSISQLQLWASIADAHPADVANSRWGWVELHQLNVQPPHLTWEELFAGSSVWTVEIFSPIISSELSPCELLAGPWSAWCCFELLPSAGSRKASLLWGLMNCTLSLGVTTAATCWLGFRMQWERVETQLFLKFSFMKAYTMGLLKLLKKPMAWTVAMIMLIVTSSYLFSRSSGEGINWWTQNWNKYKINSS